MSHLYLIVLGYLSCGMMHARCGNFWTFVFWLCFMVAFVLQVSCASTVPCALRQRSFHECLVPLSQKSHTVQIPLAATLRKVDFSLNESQCSVHLLRMCKIYKIVRSIFAHILGDLGGPQLGFYTSPLYVTSLPYCTWLPIMWDDVRKMW